VTTGWGSATYAADVQSGETVAVIGLGGIGMSAVQGAAMAGARFVVAIDPVDWKREKALTLGATHTAPTMADAQPLINEITYGAMADKAILALGLAQGEHIAPMMSLIKKAGRGVVTSVSNMMADDVKLNLFDMSMQRKELVGCIFGNANPRYDIPRLLNLYMDGKLKLDEMVTTEYTLDEINQGYQDMRDGKNIRGLIRYE
jgi:S-(hydroxymethyl)glutathione dehydrogenase/alcohol dehydrogenase